MARRSVNFENTTALRIYLMKAGTSRSQALRSDAKTSEINLNDSAQVQASLYVRNSESLAPDWVAYLRPYVADDQRASMLDLRGSSPGAVLVLETQDRVFAVTFGTGYLLLDKKRFERRFGLLVTLGAVDPEGVRELAVKTLRDVTVMTSRQASKGVSIGTFDIDAYQDLVKTAAGRAKSHELASRLAGSDGLTIVSEALLPDLPNKCGELLSIYNSGACSEQYPFIDNFRPIVDDAIVGVLEEKLVEAIAGSNPSLSIASPDTVDWQSVSEFRITTSGGASQPSVDLDDTGTHELLAQTCKQGGVSALEKSFVIGTDSATSPEAGRWSLYDCLSIELEWKNDLYVLNEGQWYEVGRSFLDRINKTVDNIALHSLPPLQRQAGEHEADFNARIAAELGYICFDRQLLRASASTIEFCDLLSPSNEMIHVKMGTKSDLLSHLFNQGLNAAEALVTDSVYRESLQEFLVKNGSSASILGLSAPARTIVYAIYTNKSGTWSKRLPFFSRMSLARTAGRIGALGFGLMMWQISS